MTTDDGLKGLTDEQLYQLWRAMWRTWSELSVGEDVSVALPKSGRAWLAANVLDSGDGERYQHMRLHGVITGETSKDGCEWIYGDELDSQIDAAILAEKGEV